MSAIVRSSQTQERQFDVELAHLKRTSLVYAFEIIFIDVVEHVACSVLFYAVVTQVTAFEFFDLGQRFFQVHDKPHITQRNGVALMNKRETMAEHDDRRVPRRPWRMTRNAIVDAVMTTSLEHMTGASPCDERACKAIGLRPPTENMVTNRKMVLIEYPQDAFNSNPVGGVKEAIRRYGSNRKNAPPATPAPEMDVHDPTGD